MRRSFLHKVPVFAIEDYALLPFTVAALQVFEPSYREMIDDCQATDRLLCVAGLDRQWRQGDPALGALHPVAGLGKLMSVRPLEDRSREVYVHGIERVRILRVIEEHPYRLAEVECLEDEPASRLDRRRQKVGLRRLNNYLNALLRAGQVSSEVSRVIASTDDPGVLSYRLGAVLLREPEARQALLEERSPLARVETLIATMGQRLIGLVESSDQPAPEGTPAPLLN